MGGNKISSELLKLIEVQVEKKPLSPDQQELLNKCKMEVDAVSPPPIPVVRAPPPTPVDQAPPPAPTVETPSPAPAVKAPPPIPKLNLTNATKEALANTNLAKAPWMRCKMMVVGEGRAGKSSTIRSLLGKSFVPALASTIGAETGETCSIDRTDNVVNWQIVNSDKGDEMALHTARAVANKMKEKKEEDENSKNKSMLPSSLIVSKLGDKVETFEDEFALSGSSSSEGKKKLDVPVVAAAQEEKKSQPTPTTSTPQTTIEPTPELMDKITKMGEGFLPNSDGSNSPGKQGIKLIIWDNGGQTVFIPLLNVFLTQQGVYTVVFDMAKMLNEDTHKETVDLLHFWLMSIKMHAPSAPVFIVGTRGDQINQPAQLAQVDKCLSNLLVAENPQIVPDKDNKRWFFAVDNTKSGNDKGIVQLRSVILEHVTKLPFVDLEIPLSWINVYEHLKELALTRSFVSTTEVAEVAMDKFGVEPNMINELLVFFNELGVLVFFDSPSLRHFVILNPQWLVSRITEVIRDFSEQHQVNLFEDSELRAKHADNVDRLVRCAILARPFMDFLWREEEPKTREFLLNVMQKTMLACPWKGSTDEFLIPSLLDLVDKNVCTVPDLVDEEVDINAKVVLKFGFLPRGLFYRLVAQLVSYAFTVYAKGSRDPVVTKTRAVMSFGKEIDFQIDVVGEMLVVGMEEAGSALVLVPVLKSMVDQLKEEIMGQELKMDVLIQVEGDNFFDWDITSEELKDGETILRNTKGKKLSADLVRPFFTPPSSILDQQQPQPVAPSQNPEGEYDLFISYHQAACIDSVGVLVEKLSQKGLKVWYDQNLEGTLNLEAMKSGVRRSRCLMVFLSEFVFTREFCQEEVREGVRTNKPILFMHEEDRRFPGYAEIYDIKRNAPEDIKELFSKVESLAFRRRKHEADAMIQEVIKRCSKS